MGQRHAADTLRTHCLHLFHGLVGLQMCLAFARGRFVTSTVLRRHSLFLTPPPHATLPCVRPAFISAFFDQGDLHSLVLFGGSDRHGRHFNDVAILQFRTCGSFAKPCQPDKNCWGDLNVPTSHI